MDSTAVISQMQQFGLWPPDAAAQQAVITLCQKHVTDVRAFARELLQREFLTAYQANLLLTGKGRQLNIGPYVILERLGEGGMGQVLKARHRQLQRVVALKVIRPDRVTNSSAVIRFLREVRAASQMDDPNIVRAYDADAADGTYYFAMEIVHGTDLSVYVRSRGPLPFDQACQLLCQAANGLQHIHEHGMVHRDIKPGNLMLALEETPTTVGPGGIAIRTTPAVLKILDLGLARLKEDEKGSNPASPLALTHEGTVIGTADYIAPEQARDGRSADIRSDIYSLGCAFYFALTGQVPFPGGAAVDKMLRHQIDEPPPLDRFRPHVPVLLATIIKKMMAKTPADRYQTPAEIVAALGPLVASDNGPPPMAIPLGQAEQQTMADLVTREERRVVGEPRQPPDRHLSLWVVAFLAALAAVIFFSLALVFAILMRALMN